MGKSETLLWIDDEIGRDDAVVRLLEMSGRHVTCAATGEEGLRAAMAGDFDYILLDLELPDLSGERILPLLRASGICAPVLVVTGHASVGAAFVTGRCGANAFVSKPVLCDELIEAMENATLGGEVRVTLPRLDGPWSHQPVVRLLRRCADASGSSASPRNPLLASSLIESLSEPGTPVRLFLHLASAWRLYHEPEEANLSEIHRIVESGIDGPGTHRPRDSRVRAAVDSLQRSIRRGQRPTERAIADDLHVHPSHLGRLLRAETGLSFRQWRLGLTMQIAVRTLGQTDDRLKQIACEGLGYGHQSEFDRQFRTLFGMSPGRFRQLVQTYSKV